MRQVALELGVSPRQLQRWCAALGIGQRVGTVRVLTPEDEARLRELVALRRDRGGRIAWRLDDLRED